MYGCLFDNKIIIIILMEIPNVRAHKIISDDFILIFKFDKITLINNYEILQKFLHRF